MPVPTRDEAKVIAGAIFGGPVRRTSHRGTSQPLALGEVMGDLIAQAKTRHPCTYQKAG